MSVLDLAYLPEPATKAAPAVEEVVPPVGDANAATDPATAPQAESRTPDASKMSFEEMAKKALATPTDPDPEVVPSDPPVEEKPAEQAAAPKGEEKAAEPEPTPEQKAVAQESIRNALNKANLPVEIKKDLANAYFRDQAVKDTGFTIDGLRQMKDLGITPELAAKVRTVAPTDEVLDYILEDATLFGHVMTDFKSSPQRFLTGLANTDAEAADKLVRSVAQHWPKIDPKAYLEHSSRDYATILQGVVGRVQARGEAATEEEQILAESAKNVFNHLFPNGSPLRQRQAPQEHPDVARLKAENEELKQKEEQRWNQIVGGFEETLRNDGQQLLDRGIRDYVERQVGKDVFDPEIVSEIVGKVAPKVLAAFEANPAIVATVQQLVASGNFDAAHRERINAFFRDQAKTLIPANIGSTLSFYTKHFRGPAKVQSAQPAKPAAVAQPAAVRPQPTQQAAPQAPSNVVPISQKQSVKGPGGFARAALAAMLS